MKKAPASYATPLKGSEVEGSSPIYRHPDFTGGLMTEHENPNMKTVWDLLTNAVKKWPNNKCHGVREINKSTGKAGPFVWRTYKEVFAKTTRFAAGVKPYLKKDVTGEMKLLGLMGLNAPEWTMAEWACIGLGGTTIPLYTTTPKETLEYVLNQNGCAVVVCDIPCAGNLIKAKPGIPGLETLVVYGKGDISELKKSGEAAGVKILSFDEVMDAGKDKADPYEPPKATDIFSFIFTSGSTGMPKGALLTHQAQVSTITSSFYNVKKCGIDPREGGGEFHLSYLPAAHVMERAFQTNVYAVGGATGYFQGKREELMDDLQCLRPTTFPSVPRLLNLIYDKIINKVRSTGGFKEKLFNKALRTKVANLKYGKLTHGLYDALIFKKIKKSLGLDRCRFIVTGSAPIAGSVLDFYRAAFGTVVIEGYGATETCASMTLTHPLLLSSEHVGGPNPNVELKLVSIPSMSYLVTDKEHSNGLKVIGRGEICARGVCIMREYYRNPEATAKAIDKDGFYHSGDVGVILPNGCFKVVDRVGNVFKLSIGEYVACEKIENACTRSSFVSSIFVHGDAFHPKLVAVVVPDPDFCASWAKENGIADGSVKSLSANDTFKKAVQADIEKTGKKNGLQSYEIPKDVFLDPEPFTIDTVLTPTLKLQRKRALEYYAKQIDAMLGPPA